MAGSKLVDALVEFLSYTGVDSIPDEIRSRCKITFLDTLGVMIAGGQETEAVRLSRRLIARGEGGNVTALVDSFPLVRLESAALLNGMAVSLLELDQGDWYSCVHPAAQVVPSLMALAEKLRRPGMAFILSFLLGYEVLARLARACRPKEGARSVAVLGPIGAAAATAHLWGFRGDRLKQAINIAANVETPVLIGDLSRNVLMKRIGTAACGFNAFFSSDLAACGFRAPDDSIERMLSKVVGEDFSSARLIDELGSGFLIKEDFKREYACHQYIQPAVEALVMIMEKRPFSWEDVKSIKVLTFAEAAKLGAMRPSWPGDEKASLSFALASYLVNRSLDPAVASFERLSDPRIEGLMERVEVVERPEFTDRFPEEWICHLYVELMDGENLEYETKEFRGSFKNPLTQQEIEAKFQRLVGRFLVPHGIRRLAVEVMRLDALDDMRKFMTLIRELRAEKQV